MWKIQSQNHKSDDAWRILSFQPSGKSTAEGLTVLVCSGNPPPAPRRLHYWFTWIFDRRNIQEAGQTSRSRSSYNISCTPERLSYSNLTFFFTCKWHLLPPLKAASPPSPNQQRGPWPSPRTRLPWKWKDPAFLPTSSLPHPPGTAHRQLVWAPSPGSARLQPYFPPPAPPPSPSFRLLLKWPPSGSLLPVRLPGPPPSGPPPSVPLQSLLPFRLLFSPRLQHPPLKAPTPPGSPGPPSTLDPSSG